MSDQILRFVGEVVTYGGTAATIAYLLFQFLGKSWIENKFAQKLEQHKHQQALEIQRLRIEIDSMLSGVLRIQEKEFETLPEAWRKLDDAYGRVSILVSPTQRYPNLDRMTTAQLEEFLATSDLLETQKQHIRDSQEKVNAYQTTIFWNKLHAVKKACSDFHNYVARYGIFFPSELREKFTKVSEDLWSAISHKELGQELQDYTMQDEGWRKVKDDIDPLYKAIEAGIHTRLHSHGHSRTPPNFGVQLPSASGLA